ncbi:MAG: uroporphyrinogen decarboxylase family protein [Verrucomicrobiota bacterium]
MKKQSGRNWALLHEDVVFGRAGGRIIWQPRIGAWWWRRVFFKEPFPPGYDCQADSVYDYRSLYELSRRLGVSARVYDYRNCFRRIEDPRVHSSVMKLNATDIENTIETPVGKQTCILRNTPNNPAPITVKWEVVTEDELRVATWREEHVSWEWSQSCFDELQRDYGDLGAPTMYLPRMNVQCLYLEKTGVENGVFAIYDWPKTAEKFFAAREESNNRLIEQINRSPIKIINFGENVHAGTLSPELFRKYHLPECQRRCENLHRSGKFCHSHWDGDTKPILRYAQETGLDGIEAITPVPQGDVTLEEIKDGLGDRMFLLDGLPAVFFDETYPVQELIDCTHRLIDLFAPRLVLGISDEISATGDIERIRIVSRIVNEYNAHFESPGAASAYPANS